MIIHTIKGKTPSLGKDCFVAETAAVLGDVTLGDNCSVWYSAVIRGDDNSIRIGNRVSIQDCTVIHVSEGPGGSVVIGDDVVLGHNATIHAATIGSHCLVGMGATILDGAVVEDGSMVAAGALVLGRTHIGKGELWAGVPAKFVKNISPEVVERTIDGGVKSYVEWGKVYSELLSGQEQ